MFFIQCPSKQPGEAAGLLPGREKCYIIPEFISTFGPEVLRNGVCFDLYHTPCSLRGVSPQDFTVVKILEEGMVFAVFVQSLGKFHFSKEVKSRKKFFEAQFLKEFEAPKTFWSFEAPFVNNSKAFEFHEFQSIRIPSQLNLNLKAFESRR